MMKKDALLRRWIIALILLILVVPVMSFAAGSETDPRDAFPAPGGTQAFLLYYRNTTGDKLKANGNNASNIDFDSSMAIARYVRYWAFDKITIAGNIIQPFGYQDLEIPGGGGSIHGSSSGLGDTTLGLTMYYHWLPNQILSIVSAYGIAPTGAYNHNNLVNLGSNRWNFRINATPFAWKKDKFTLELIGSVDLYTANSDYTASSVTLKQDPIYTVQGHVTYDITKTFWIGASYFCHSGGETEVNHVKQHNDTTEHKVMGTAGILTTPHTQMLLQYATDVDLDNGIPIHEIRVRFAFFWK